MTTKDSATAIEVEDMMIIASFCPPTDADPQEHASLLEEMLICIALQGKMLWCAGWTQELDEAWSVALAAMFDAKTVPISASSTRWNGKSLIDFVISNVPNLHSHTLDSQISDHKISETSLVITCWLRRLALQKGCQAGSTILALVQDVEQTAAEAFEIERSTGWQCACKEMDIEDIAMDLEGDHEQEMTDFIWRFSMLKLLTMYRTAFI